VFDPDLGRFVFRDLLEEVFATDERLGRIEMVTKPPLPETSPTQGKVSGRFGCRSTAITSEETIQPDTRMEIDETRAVDAQDIDSYSDVSKHTSEVEVEEFVPTTAVDDEYHVAVPRGEEHDTEGGAKGENDDLDGV